MQTKLKRLAGIVALAIGGLTAGNASSAVLFDNTGGYSSDSNNVALTSVGDWAATKFSISSGCATGCLLDSVLMPLQSNSVSSTVGTGQFTVSIHSNTPVAGFDGSVGDPLTNSGNITNPAGSIATQDLSQHVLYEFSAPQDPLAGITLFDNTDYWLKITALSATPAAIMWDAVVGGVRQFANTGGTFGPPGGINTYSWGMIVNGEPLSAVPVPAAVWLMGSALIGFVGWGRRVKV